MTNQRAYLELHLAVFLFGFTAILGELISLPSLALVWWRVLITSISLLFIVKWWKTIPQLSRKRKWQFIGIGTIVALHWVTFYGSIKLSNASVTLVCFATTSFMTAVLEPIITKAKFNRLDLSMGLLVIPAMVFIVGSLPTGMVNGVLMGLFSALLAVIFSIFNKQLVDEAPPLTITLLELGAATFFLGVVILGVKGIGTPLRLIPAGLDWVYLMVLALVCTTLPYALVLRAMKKVSAFIANLSINMEPVYGIVLGAVLLNNHEELNTSFYLGSILIMAIVFLHPILARRLERAEA